jgi:hypothetical protein
MTVARRTAATGRAGHATAPLDEEALVGAAGPADIDAFWLEGALARLAERQRTVIDSPTSRI